MWQTVHGDAEVCSHACCSLILFNSQKSGWTSALFLKVSFISPGLSPFPGMQKAIVLVSDTQICLQGVSLTLGVSDFLYSLGHLMKAWTLCSQCGLALCFAIYMINDPDGLLLLFQAAEVTGCFGIIARGGGR